MSCLIPSRLEYVWLIAKTSLKGSSSQVVFDTIARYFAVHGHLCVSRFNKLGMASKMPQPAPATSTSSTSLSQPKAPRSVTASRPSSRSTTPIPRSFDKPANDHTISFRPRLSQKEHPPDCPPLRVRWFYAVDVCSSTP